MEDNNVVLDSLIFPAKHLPKCFSNYDLYSEFETIYNQYDSLVDILNDNFSLRGEKINEFKGFKDENYGLKKGTEPINIYISKPNGANRVLAVVNPLVLIPLHFYINYYSDEILKEQLDATNNYESSSKFFFVEGKFVRLYDYNGNPIISEFANMCQKNYKCSLMSKQKICDGKYYHLGLDINNFFNSIYTHSISWKLLNNKNKIIFDNIDYLTRTLNRNETKGIAIGPYTSSLFSEIILSKVDRAIIETCKEKNISFTRFCDDYDFYCDSKEKLENDVRLMISENLSEYKLDLNMNKLKLEEFPFVSMNTIQNKHIFLLMKRIKENNYENSLEFVEDVMNEINNAIKIKYSNCNYLLKILKTKIAQKVITSDFFENDTAEILLDFLINMAFKQNMIATDVFNLIIEIFNLIQLDKNRIVVKWIKKRNSRISHIKEIIDIWLAYLIIKLKVCDNVCDNYMLEIMKNSDLCAILAFEYFYNNNLFDKYKNNVYDYLSLIKIELSSRYGDNWRKACYYSRFWLFFYTNSIRWKIHKKSGFYDSIFSDLDLYDLIIEEKMHSQLKLFKIMFENNIEFVVF